MNSNSRIIVAAPASTAERLIFPLRNTEFDSSFYNPSFTDGRAGTEEIRQVLTEIQAVRQPIFANLKKAQTCYVLFVVLSLLAMFCLGFFLAVFIDPTVAFLSFVIFLFLFVIASWNLRSKVLQAMKDSQAAVNQVLEKYSGSFSSRGLRWSLPAHFPSWIELHKDYLLSQNAGGQPVYMPPNMYQQPAPIYPAQGQPQFQNQYQQHTSGAYNV